ncbi:hypothetical protein BDV36DRAFT_253124 [Aspergillus pseudocaelatus]|uniref:Uncharacterized protein n=1 Tax=Aspergillus pseudocaelatus TaxID=1825620 RepID=A0ABQ6WNV2_9EURO|nr:hypothetical protein BDV36DRAFT_253124 [Aspergillus pseudocaelatus]
MAWFIIFSMGDGGRRFGWYCVPCEWLSYFMLLFLSFLFLFLGLNFLRLPSSYCYLGMKSMVGFCFCFLCVCFFPTRILLLLFPGAFCLFVSLYSVCVVLNVLGSLGVYSGTDSIYLVNERIRKKDHSFEGKENGDNYIRYFPVYSIRNTEYNRADKPPEVKTACMLPK